MATTPRKDLPSTNAPNWNQRVTEELRVLMGRAGNGRALTAKDLIDSGIAKPGAGGGLVPGVPGGGDTEPDLTPPPMPTGFAVSAGLSTVFVEHDAPGYTQGHGHDRTVVYGVLQTGSSAPTFDQAVVLFQFQGTIGAYPAALGTRYRLWIKWQSQDGVQSVSPAGGTNGLDVQTGKIGNNDLGPLIVEAGNLANGSVSASKLAAQAVDATKFAAGIEPVSVSTAGTLPTVKSTSTIVWQGKLYRWDGSKYTASVPTVDLTGTIIASQIAAGAIDATKFASGIEPVTNSAAASLPTVKSTTVITWQGKLYRWDGAKYTAEVAVVDLSGQIDAAKLADNAVTVSKIAAGAVEAGKLATGAVTADKIAAAAVDTTKFASGIEPVTNSTASTLPTVKSTTTITWQGKLYRWDGSKYTAAVPTTDLTGTVASAQIADSAITLAKIATGSVDTTKFAAGIEPVSNSTAGTLPTVKSTTVITWQGKLYRWDGAKYSAEVAVGDMVGQIAATQIADNAITTPKLAANSVVADKIAANAVVAAALSADAVTAGKIAAGAVNTRELAANSVTASKLVITATDAVNVDPFFQDGSIWSGINWSRKVGEVGSPGPFVLSSLVNQANLFNGSWTPIDISRTYLFETWFKAFGSHANRAFASIRFYDVNGAALINADAPSIGWPGVNASAGNYYFPAVGTTTPQEWTRYTLTVGPNGVAKFPPKAAFFVVGAFLNYSGATPVVESQWGGIRITEMARGELVVDGAITASKMTLTDSTNFVADPDFRDYAAWSVGAVQNFSFEDGEVADNTQRVATYTTALRTGAANAYISEFVQQPRISMETGRQVFISVKIRDYLGAEGRVDLGIATTKAAGTTYSNVLASRVLGTADGYVTLTATYVVAADDVAIGWRVRWQYSAAGRFVGPFKVMNPVLRVMGQAELLVDGAITAAKIAAGAVTAGKIAAGAVTAGTIAANAVTANEIAANAVTTAKIAAGAVSAAQVAANAITASKLAISDTTNLVPDQDFVDAAAWNAVAPWTFETSPPDMRSQNVARFGYVAGLTGYGANLISKRMAIEAGREYTFGIQSKPVSATASYRYWYRVHFYDSTGAAVITNGVSQTWIDIFVGTVTAAGVVEQSRQIVTPATAVSADVRIYVDRGATSVDILFAGLYGRMAARGELIVDGAITAVKIAAKTITAAQIAAGTITATELGAGSVTAGKIAAGSITATELAANSVTALQLAANAVTAGKIAANAITANELAANSVTTAKIAAGAVSATELAAGSVLASKLLVADTTNVYGDFDCVDPDYCTAVTGSFVYSTSGAAYNGKNIVNIPPFTGATEVVSSWFVMDAGAEYLITQRISTSVNDATGLASTYIELASYNSVTVVPTRRELIGQTGSTSANPFTLSVALTTGERYGRIIYARAAGGTSRAYIGAPTIRRKNGGNLIVDGAITASKMVLADTSNAYPDFDMLDDGGYSSATAFDIIGGNSNYGSKRVLRILAGTAASVDAMVMAYADRGIQVEANSQYFVSFQMSRINSGTAGTVQFLTRLGVKTSQTAITWDAAVAQVSDTTTVTNITYRSFILTTGTRTRLSVGMRILSGAAAGGYLSAITIRKMNGAELIVDGAIIAGKIATNAVTADKIEANAITAAKIAVGAVGADQIAANAITVKQLTVMDYSNIVLDPFIQDTTSWATFTGTQVTAATSGVPVNMPGPAGILLSKATAQSVLTRNFQTSPGEVYYLSAYVASPTTTGYAIRLMMQFIDPTGAQGDASGTHVGWAAAITLTAPAAVNTWQKIEGFVTVPAGVAFGRARIVSETGSAVAGSWYATNFVCRRATSAGLIVDGAITATKIAAGAIAVGSAAIQDGAIVNAMIGNLSADKINAGTLNAARIAAGTITSTHLAANSVIAGKIAANAVTAGNIAANAVIAGTIAANAVTAAQIAAGSITVDKLAAGSVTASKLTVGTGGNLCTDSGFTPGLAFWSKDNYMRSGNWGVNLNVDYAVNGSPTLWVEDTAGVGGAGYMGVNSVPMSVIPGERYEASCYFSSHRCTAEIIMLFQNDSGQWGAATLGGTAVDEASGWKLLSNFKRVGGFFTIPAGMTKMTLILRKYATQTGTSSYLFATRPFVGFANANQTELSPWSPSGSTSLLPDGITTPSISALAGKFGDIEIRPTAGASGCIRVYDTNGTLRVRLGVW